jgi:hypothetical protein
MLKNNLITDPDLAERFGDELGGRYAPARVEDVDALINSFGRFATRKYDRPFVTTSITQALAAAVATIPKVTPQVLSPYQTIDMAKGEKASGYLCDGSKYGFHSNYADEMLDLLANPSSVLSIIPIYTIIPKVEIRDIKKDARDLAFGPAWFTDLSMMFEKDFFLCNMVEWPNSPMKVGIPMPQGWPYLVHGLRAYRNSSFQTWFAEWDASQFDRSHPVELTLTWERLLEIFGVVKQLFADEPKKQALFYVCFWSVFRLVLLPDGRIVLVQAGIYSGDISTTNKNTIFHIVRLALCWMDIFGTIVGFRQFMKISGICLFGDDAICAAHNAEHLYFLQNLQAAWERCFGSELKMHLSTRISEVSFLGKRSLGDDDISMMYPVSSDLDRQIASLVLKTKKGQTPVMRLSKLLAHRLLLAGFCLNTTNTISDQTKSRNTRGLDLLQRIDSAISAHVSEYGDFFQGDPEWVGLLYPATCDAEELYSRVMLGRDTILPEGFAPDRLV